ncbi:hypothetical protein Tco_0766959 [Tanacetum coccineum]
MFLYDESISAIAVLGRECWTRLHEMAMAAFGVTILDLSGVDMVSNPYGWFSSHFFLQRDRQRNAVFNVNLIFTISDDVAKRAENVKELNRQFSTIDDVVSPEEQRKFLAALSIVSSSLNRYALKSFIQKFRTCSVELFLLAHEVSLVK